ncbi:hypothetical protein [Salirhabdus sp. Marseille-P4669]|uniref:hypothetical protein n=1 Tax=Salirhabdus sp. Marseille-P4669 TaxID=2042310 RepID=UPI000C7C7580|nr:hypothetical protein [Salirhabdus sp. Marseille-P4669]
MLEWFVIVTIGLYSTIEIVKPTYEYFGVPFLGNVWVNWFGVSYLIFAIYTLLFRILMKEQLLYQRRLASTRFWLFSVIATLIVVGPIINGKNLF